LAYVEWGDPVGAPILEFHGLPNPRQADTVSNAFLRDRGIRRITVDPEVITAGVGAILLMAIALAAVVHGEETRIKRLEPDAVVLLLAYIGALVAVGAASV
jgi:hypothetical protein